MPSVSAYPAATWQRPAASGMLCLLLVFLAGVTVGAVAMSLGLHNSLHKQQTASSVETANAMTLRRWKKDLDLTDDQTRQIETLLDDFSKLYDNVLADGSSRIRLILNDEQKVKFDRILKERR